MGPAGYFIAILGCADGAAQCQPVATMPTHYDSVAACSAETANALMANRDLDFPTLLAQCRPAAAKSSSGKPPVKLPDGARRA